MKPDIDMLLDSLYFILTLCGKSLLRFNVKVCKFLSEYIEGDIQINTHSFSLPISLPPISTYIYTLVSISDCASGQINKFTT